MGWVFFLIKTSATYALSVLVAKSPYCYSIENLYVHQEWGEIIFPLYYIHHLQTKQLIIFDCSVNKKRHQKKNSSPHEQIFAKRKYAELFLNWGNLVGPVTHSYCGKSDRNAQNNNEIYAFALNEVNSVRQLSRKHEIIFRYRKLSREQSDLQ